jgi:hypothetical protein
MKKNEDLFGNKVEEVVKEEVAKRIKSREETIKRRNADINKRFNKLYNEDRIRYDDCISKLAYEFYLSEDSIGRILKK